MIIRSANSDDIPALADIARSAYAVYLPRMDRPPAPMTVDFAPEIEAGNLDVLLGEESDVVGFILHFSREDHWFIENVAVHPAHQGVGLGGHLIRAAEDEARSNGLAEVRLYTNAAMIENLAFYERRGYRRTGRLVEDGFDRIYFSKHLGDA